MWPITIRDLVSEAGANTSLLNSISYDIQAPLYRVRAGVVIDDTGCTVADGVNHKHFSAGLRILQCQELIKPPPQALEDLWKVTRWFTRNSHATGKRAIKMGMRTKKARHNQAVVRIDVFGIGMLV